MPPKFLDIDGTSSESYQIALEGPIIRKTGDLLEIVNKDGTDFAILRCANPVNDSDVVNFLTFKTKKGNVVIKRQADTSASIPTNTAVRGFLVVSTAGTGAVIGDLLYDDGSSSGPMSIVGKDDGRSIVVTVPLTGGSVEFDAETIYTWDDDGLVWIKSSNLAATGAERIIKLPFGIAATVDSTTQIPANAEVYRREIDITTVYPATKEITIGHSTTDDLLGDSAAVPNELTRKFWECMS